MYKSVLTDANMVGVTTKTPSKISDQETPKEAATRKSRLAQLPDVAEYPSNYTTSVKSFIVVELSDGTGGAPRSILRFGEVAHHQGIEEQLYLELSEKVLSSPLRDAPPIAVLREKVGKQFSVVIKGGGFIGKYDKTKRISVSGESGEFGPPDYAVVVVLLKSFYSDYQVFSDPEIN